MLAASAPALRLDSLRARQSSVCLLLLHAQVAGKNCSSPLVCLEDHSIWSQHQEARLREVHSSCLCQGHSYSTACKFTVVWAEGLTGGLQDGVLKETGTALLAPPEQAFALTSLSIRGQALSALWSDGTLQTFYLFPTGGGGGTNLGLRLQACRRLLGAHFPCNTGSAQCK